MHQHTDTHKYMVSYGSALLSLWLNCKPNKSNSQNCLLLQFAAMGQVKVENRNFNLFPTWLYSLRNKAYFQVLHDPLTSADLGSESNVWKFTEWPKERREDDDWEYPYAKSIFWSTATDKAIRCHKSHCFAEIQWLNNLGLKSFQYQNYCFLQCACPAKKGSSEMPTSLRQSLELCQHKWHSSGTWGCGYGHMKAAEWIPSLSAVLFVTLIFFKWIWTSVMQMPAIKIWHGPVLLSWHQKHRADLHEHRGWLAEVVGTSS